jgi:hypothetical protein
MFSSLPFSRQLLLLAKREVATTLAATSGLHMPRTLKRADVQLERHASIIGPASHGLATLRGDQLARMEG